MIIIALVKLYTNQLDKVMSLCNSLHQEVINCLGGLQVLFPLLENLDQSNASAGLPENSPTTPSRKEAQELDLGNWTLVDVSPPASGEFACLAVACPSMPPVIWCLDQF